MMKKMAKPLVVTAAVFVVVGIGLMIAGGLMGGRVTDVLSDNGITFKGSINSGGKNNKKENRDYENGGFGDYSNGGYGGIYGDESLDEFFNEFFNDDDFFDDFFNDGGYGNGGYGNGDYGNGDYGNRRSIDL